MTSKADKFWDKVAGKLRKAEGFSIPTPEKLEAELEAIEAEPLTEEQIEKIVEAVSSRTEYRDDKIGRTNVEHR